MTTPAISPPLPLATLRLANRARLPTLKNRHGVPAHAKPDGSDWTVNDWYTAFVGELGEVMEMLGYDDDPDNLAAEIADAVIYLDLLAFRMGVEFAAAAGRSRGSTFADMARKALYQGAFPHPDRFFGAALRLGNTLKKLRRGDLADTSNTMMLLALHADEVLECLVALAKQTGVNLDAAVADTFNRKSEEVTSPITLRIKPSERPLDAHVWEVWDWRLGRALTWADMVDPDATSVQAALAERPRSIGVSGAGVADDDPADDALLASGTAHTAGYVEKLPPLAVDGPPEADPNAVFVGAQPPDGGADDAADQGGAS